MSISSSHPCAARQIDQVPRLGLLIVDGGAAFWRQPQERLKPLRAEVHVLTPERTPIRARFSWH